MKGAEDSSRKETVTIKGNWVTYRSEIRVLDCTIRDGGLINEHQFDDNFVKRVYKANVEAGVDYMEMGYKADKKVFSRAKCGTWKFCDEDDIRRITGDNPTDLKLTVMADADRTDYKQDILPKDKSVIDVVRMAAYIHQISSALDMVADAKQKGYQEVCLNLMAVSVVPEHELDDALKAIMRSDVDTIYLVDSFGAFYGEQVAHLVTKYLKAAEGTGKEVGIHTHNNQQLAYANTIEAIIRGANRVDATYAGMGRGAGNCPLDLIIGFLHNPKYHLRPVLQCVEEIFLPMAEKMHWGYSIPYMLTGQLNQHPRAAIAQMKPETRNKIVEFYDTLIQEIS
ncbi:MAG: aldolase catalytic domain-containing protein [Planctomycetota bacterium]